MSTYIPRRINYQAENNKIKRALLKEIDKTKHSLESLKKNNEGFFQKDVIYKIKRKIRELSEFERTVSNLQLPSSKYLDVSDIRKTLNDFKRWYIKEYKKLKVKKDSIVQQYNWLSQRSPDIKNNEVINLFNTIKNNILKDASIPMVEKAGKLDQLWSKIHLFSLLEQRPEMLPNLSRTLHQLHNVSNILQHLENSILNNINLQDNEKKQSLISEILIIFEKLKNLGFTDTQVQNRINNLSVSSTYVELNALKEQIEHQYQEFKNQLEENQKIKAEIEAKIYGSSLNDSIKEELKQKYLTLQQYSQINLYNFNKEFMRHILETFTQENVQEIASIIESETPAYIENVSYDVVTLIHPNFGRIVVFMNEKQEIKFVPENIERMNEEIKQSFHENIVTLISKKIGEGVSGPESVEEEDVQQLIQLRQQL